MKNFMKIMIVIFLISIFTIGCASKKSLMTSGLPKLTDQKLINKKRLNNDNFVEYKTYIDVDDGYGERAIFFELKDNILNGFFEYYSKDDKKFKIGILKFSRIIENRQPELEKSLYFKFNTNNISGGISIDILQAYQESNPELIKNMELYVFKKKNYEYDLEYIKGNNKLLMHMFPEKKTYHVNNNLKYPLKGAIIYLYAGTRMLIPDGLGVTRVNICVLENHKNIFKHESRIGKNRYNVNYNHKSLNEIIKKIEKGKCDSFVAKADDVIDFLDKGSSWSLVK